MFKYWYLIRDLKTGRLCRIFKSRYKMVMLMLCSLACLVTLFKWYHWWTNDVKLYKVYSVDVVTIRPRRPYSKYVHIHLIMITLTCEVMWWATSRYMNVVEIILKYVVQTASSINKTDRFDIREILLKVALNTISITLVL
jgi:hypothetical protein